MVEKQLRLTLIKSTKGTHVYGDDSPEAAIPSVYIKKTALPDPPPKVLAVTLAAPSDD